MSRSTACSSTAARRAPAGWAASSSLSASSTAASRKRLMLGSPRISLSGLPPLGVRRNAWPSPPSTSAHAADSSSSSTTWRPERRDHTAAARSQGPPPPSRRPRGRRAAGRGRSAAPPTRGRRDRRRRRAVVARQHPCLDDLPEELPGRSLEQGARREPSSGLMVAIMATNDSTRTRGARVEIDRYVVAGRADRAQTPRRALSPSSSVQSTVGRLSPNFSNHSVICGISAFHSSTSTARAASSSSCGQVEAVDVERARAPGRGRSGVSTAAAWPSMRSMTHLSTRLFSPKPGQRKPPSSERRNQLT